MIPKVIRKPISLYKNPFRKNKINPIIEMTIIINTINLFSVVKLEKYSIAIVIYIP